MGKGCCSRRRGHLYSERKSFFLNRCIRYLCDHLAFRATFFVYLANIFESRKDQFLEFKHKANNCFTFLLVYFNSIIYVSFIIVAIACASFSYHSKHLNVYLTGNSKMMRYVDGMKSKVHHVVAEAKAVLEDTGKVVHGLKKVLSGAKRLTEFTNNAVTFAKYFAREPTNATVDFFEEKAVIAVLESQKAAADAKIAAVVAREAARKVKLIAKRIRGKNKSFDKKLSKAVKYAEGQAHRAEQAARISSFNEKDARKDAIIADKALRKMIKLANEKKEAEKDEETKKEPEDIHSKEQENGYEGSGESESEGEAEKLTNNENENVKQKEEPSVNIKEQKNKQLSEGDGTESNSTRKESIEEKLEQGENGNKTERLKETKTNEETVDSSSNVSSS